MFTIGSLFAGIGGFELGLEWAGLGPVRWQVEKEEKRRGVLEHHWPKADRSVTDVSLATGANLAPVDLICGGFPCQDVSSAGRRAGLGGKRSGLWSQFARVVGELRPRWVAIENVTSGARKWVDPVVRELEFLGYACLPLPIRASDLGAPHARARLFVVAANAHGLGAGLHAKAGPRIAVASNGAVTPDPHSGGLRIESGREPRANGQKESEPSSAHADAHHDSGELRKEKRPGLPDAKRHGGWTVEPEVARMVHGLSGRVDRERFLGDSIVPACAEAVGWAIRRIEGI